jgi:hypothetical protein
MSALSDALAEFDRVNRDDFWSVPREQWKITFPMEQAMALVLAARKANSHGFSAQTQVKTGHDPNLSWLPIGGAPRDGTLVDVWLRTPSGGERVPNAKWARPPAWNHETWCRYLEDDWNCWLEIDSGDGWEVTHYMPIPAGPT